MLDPAAARDEIVDRKRRQNGAEQIMEIEDGRCRGAEEDRLPHLTAIHPADESEDRENRCQQREAVGTSIRGRERDVHFKAEENAGEECGLSIQKFAGSAKEKVNCAEHRQQRRDL